MKVKTGPRGIAALLAASAALSIAACSITDPIRGTTGVVSHTLCSEVFVSGLDPDQVYAESIKPRPGIKLLSWAIRYKVDTEHHQVSATVAGAFDSRALYRDGFGCLLIQGKESGDLLQSQAPRTEGQRYSSLLPEIAPPDVVEPVNEKLRQALDRAFAEPVKPPYRRTKAVVVVHNGQIVAERYARGYGITTPLLGYSATKSVISAIIGILVREGKLSVEQPAPVPAWQAPGDPRHAITIDDLLRMKSGLALNQTGSGFDPVTRMEYLERDMAGFAESVKLEAAPGSSWNYTDGNYIILSRIIRDLAGRHAEDVLHFARRELFGPLGMSTVTLEFDATGTPVGSTYMLASARDWARFGMLYLNDGVAGGQRILPQGWVRYSSTPALGTGYGAGFWTNLGQSALAKERVGWGMPEDSFFAYGILGQYVVVVPSRQLVVARFGATQRWTGVNGFDTEGVARLVADVIATIDNQHE